MGILVVACLVTVATAPIVRHALLRQGVMDVPNERSSHSVPVPRGGGIACMAGLAAGVVVAAAQQRQVPWLPLAGVALLAGVGFADDRGSLRPSQRLGVQVVVGALVGGVIGGPWWILAGAIALPVTVNAVNFMDGINGITGLNAVLWGVVAMYLGHASGALMVIGAAAAGASLGFLPWNAPVARLFLGDVGSYFFGALIGVGILEGAHEGVRPLLLVAPLSVYLADTGVTLVRRALRGAPLTTAHREHAYQRLVDQTRLPHVAVAAATALLALAITVAWWLLPTFAAVAVTAALLAGYVISPELPRWLRAGPHTSPGRVVP